MLKLSATKTLTPWLKRWATSGICWVESAKTLYFLEMTSWSHFSQGPNFLRCSAIKAFAVSRHEACQAWPPQDLLLGSPLVLWSQGLDHVRYHPLGCANPSLSSSDNIQWILWSVPVPLQSEAHSPQILLARQETQEVAKTITLLVIGK